MPWDALIDVANPRWGETLRRVPTWDFHHLPGYVELEAERRSSEAKAFLYEEDQGVFMVPFLESTVPLAIQPAGKATRDAIAPYGYAGPLLLVAGTESERELFVARALKRLIERLEVRGICAALIRFHPLLAVPLGPFQQLGHLVFHGETVWADLRLTAEQAWSETRRDFRNPINRLQRQGFTFEIDADGRHLHEFVKIYHDTMMRVHAEPQYFFSEEYIRGLRGVLGPGFVLAHVRDPAGAIVSSGIFTVCSGIVQFHLSGSRLGSDGSDASKFLLHGVRNWARQHGLEKFHLGGGVGAKNDSLFQFKSGFASGRARFYTWRVVVDSEAYYDLCEQWERRYLETADPLEGYFPAYRKLLPPPMQAVTRQCA